MLEWLAAFSTRGFDDFAATAGAACADGGAARLALGDARGGGARRFGGAARTDSAAAERQHAEDAEHQRGQAHERAGDDPQAPIARGEIGLLDGRRDRRRRAPRRAPATR